MCNDTLQVKVNTHSAGVSPKVVGVCLEYRYSKLELEDSIKALRCKLPRPRQVLVEPLFKLDRKVIHDEIIQNE